MAIALRVGLAGSLLACLVLHHTAANDKPKRPVKPEQLQTLINRADKLVVYIATSEQGGRILYSSPDPKDISALKDAISIEPSDGGEFLYLCTGSPEIVLFRKGKELASVTVLAYGAIHVSLWDSDAMIHDREKFLRWFDDRKITGPREDFEREKAEEEARRVIEARWMAAMPEVLRPLWATTLDQMMPGGIPQTPDTKPLKPILTKEFPDESKRIRALLSWYGSGAGPWSGFPFYEEVPQLMLLEYPTSHLVAAVEGVTLSEQEAEGAARLFADWDFHQRRPDDGVLISKDLKLLLLQQSLKSADPDKVERARKAFE